MNFDTYPHDVYCSVALLDNKIINYKIGDRPFAKETITWRGQISWDQAKTVVVEYTTFEVKDDEEHNRAFEVNSKEWMKQWEIHEQHRGGKPYESLT